jgi:hypothetical protein
LLQQVIPILEVPVETAAGDLQALGQHVYADGVDALVHQHFSGGSDPVGRRELNFSGCCGWGGRGWKRQLQTWGTGAADAGLYQLPRVFPALSQPLAPVPEGSVWLFSANFHHTYLYGKLSSRVYLSAGKLNL